MVTFGSAFEARNLIQFKQMKHPCRHADHPGWSQDRSLATFILVTNHSLFHTRDKTQHAPAVIAQTIKPGTAQK